MKLYTGKRGTFRDMYRENRRRVVCALSGHNVKSWRSEVGGGFRMMLVGTCQECGQTVARPM